MRLVTLITKNVPNIKDVFRIFVNEIFMNKVDKKSYFYRQKNICKWAKL